jgi:SAM-dependent methyltransferase
MDMRHVGSIGESFDAVISMWQSFGYFDGPTNADILGQLRTLLRPKGRLVLDVYDPRFFEALPPVRRVERAPRVVTTRQALRDNRLTVILEYEPDGVADRFDWQLFTPEELGSLADRLGFQRVLACSGFDEARAPAGSVPRMQLVLARI